MIIDCHSHHISAPYNTNYFTWAEQTGHRDYGPPYLWNNPVFEDISKRIEIMREYHITYTDNIYVDTHSMSENGIQCAAEILGEDKILFANAHKLLRI